MIVEKVKIKGYEAIKDTLELSFETPFSVIIGKNASGKSSILQAIRHRFYNNLNDEIISISPKNIDGKTKSYIVRSTKGVIEQSTGKHEGDADFERLLKGADKKTLEVVSENVSNAVNRKISLIKNYENKIIVCDNDKEIDRKSLSAGLQAILTIESILNYNRIKSDDKVVFLIEEPENFLHPNLLRCYINKFKKLVNENIERFQFILTSHSNIVLSMVEPDEIIRIHDAKVFSINKLSEKDKNDWSYLVDQNKADLFFSDRVLFVEGLSDKLIFSQLLRNNFIEPADYNTTVIHTDGVYNLNLFENLCNEFGIKGLFVRDCDKGFVPGKLTKKSEYFHELILPYCFSSYTFVELEDIIPMEDWAYYFSSSLPEKTFSFLNSAIQLKDFSENQKFSKCIKNIKHSIRIYNCLYKNRKLCEGHPLNHIFQIIKKFIECGEVIHPNIVDLPHPTDVLEDCFWYLISKNLFSETLSVNDLISWEEKIICFGYKFNINEKEQIETIVKTINKLLVKNILFYIVANKKEFLLFCDLVTKIKDIDFYSAGNYLIIKNENGSKSYIVRLERQLVAKDKDKLIDFEPIVD